MGQTLTHGVYLPSEGERNCYNGLAANWQLLDGAVGTVAEHTTQIAGKAPAVHTHTKADITDFPAYGNAAGTICEGNDSRLSDARTPVAHTHTKSDVTDLLNSNFIPSANNSYDLGSSSYQWNNLYANTVNAANAVYTNTVGASSVRAQGTSNSLLLAAMETWEDGGRIFMYGKDNVNGSTIYADIDHNDGIHSKTGVSLDVNGFYPSGVSRHLGLSNENKKWLTFNGVNPGALSLPNFDSDGYVDLSSDLTENVQYVYTPTVDGWLALFAIVTGFHAENAVGIFNADTTLGINSFRWAASATAAINLQRQTGKYFGSVILPVRAGYPHLCWLKVDQSTTLGQKWLIFYKAKGNV